MDVWRHARLEGEVAVRSYFITFLAAEYANVVRGLKMEMKAQHRQARGRLQNVFISAPTRKRAKGIMKGHAAIFKPEFCKSIEARRRKVAEELGKERIEVIYPVQDGQTQGRVRVRARTTQRREVVARPGVSMFAPDITGGQLRRLGMAFDFRAGDERAAAKEELDFARRATAPAKREKRAQEKVDSFVHEEEVAKEQKPKRARKVQNVDDDVASDTDVASDCSDSARSSESGHSSDSESDAASSSASSAVPVSSAASTASSSDAE